eukprot:TRINITY_DN41612_c0_g1_i1.p1 TRINITY_DN41612_c0_g1~~TRINITY_DN41612_c0_g1_i1.p1  ORF type:complete len:450 (-),score=87.22 TRINITY_DN41612_c0_g1_i1:33-1382(-)
MLLEEEEHVMEIAMKEWDQDAPPLSHTMLFCLEILSSWFPFLAKLCVLFLFAVILPLKLQGTINGSWYWVCVPLYLFAFINLVELATFFCLWTHWRSYKREVDYFNSLGKAPRYLILWPGDKEPPSYTPLFGMFSYTMGNSHSSNCFKRDSHCRALLSAFQNPFIKTTQVLSGVTFCILLPYALSSSSSSAAKALPFLWLWYATFLLWGMYEKVVRSYYEANSESQIAASGIFAVCMSLGLLTLTIWIFLWAFSSSSSSSGYYYGAIPVIIAACCLFCFPLWLCVNRRHIATHPDYYPPGPLEDPGDLHEGLIACAMCTILQPILVLTGIFFAWKLAGDKTWSWVVIFIPLWIGLIVLWLVYAAYVRYDAGYEFEGISLKSCTSHLEDPQLNDIWKKEVLLGTFKRLLGDRRIDASNSVNTIFEMTGWFKGAHRFDRSPLLLQSISVYE